MRQVALPIAAVVLVVLAGCTGTTGQPSVTAPGDATTTERPTPQAGSTPTPPGECPADADPPDYPDPPKTLSGVAVKNVALDSERAHVHRELCQRAYDDFGVGGGISYPEATVLNDTDGAVVVWVRVPYTTFENRGVPPGASTPPGGGTPTPVGVEGDGVSYGVYRITTDSVERLRDGTGR